MVTRKLLKIVALGITLVFTTVMSASVLAANAEVKTHDKATVEKMLSEARSKFAAGDKEGAATLYRAALKIDASNPVIRSELAALLIDAAVKDPYSDQSEVAEHLAETAAEPDKAANNSQ